MAQAVRDLLIHLPPPLKRKVKLAFQALAEDPYQAKPLKDELAGLRSFRVMRSRIILRIRILRRNCGLRSKKGYISPGRQMNFAVSGNPHRSSQNVGIRHCTHESQDFQFPKLIWIDVDAKRNALPKDYLSHIKIAIWEKAISQPLCLRLDFQIKSLIPTERDFLDLQPFSPLIFIPLEIYDTFFYNFLSAFLNSFNSVRVKQRLSRFPSIAG